MKTILIVDDEPGIVEVARDYLAQAGFETLVARDGVAGLSLARQRRPDLIVLDLGLPGMNGLDVTRGAPPRLSRADHHAHRPRRRVGQARGAGARG